jgi:hypothetical protein
MRYTRLVRGHVPNPINVLKQKALAIRKGGGIILADDDHDIFSVLFGIAGLFGVYDRMDAVRAPAPSERRITIPRSGKISGQPVTNPS